MRSKIISTLALATASMLTLGTQPAMAAEQTLRAPYASSGIVNNMCSGCTTNTVTPDAQTGRVDALSEVVRAPLDPAGGVAATNGAIYASTNLPTRTRTVDVTATLTLSEVSTTLAGATSDERNKAHVTVRVTLSAACGGCVGGTRSVVSTATLADADPLSPEPASATGTVSISLPRLQFAKNEKSTGPATVSVEAMTSAALEAFCSCTLTTARAARARSDVTLASVRLVTA